MPHRITFHRVEGAPAHLSEQEMRDLVDVLYRWDDSSFVITLDRKDGTRRGQHSWNPMTRNHAISLFHTNIAEAIRLRQRLGGNMSADDPKLGAAMVLAHELQHANQSQTHSTNEQFYRKKEYNKRPAEREARAFVDDNIETIAAIIGHPLASAPLSPPAMDPDADPAKLVADDIGGPSEVSLGQVREALRELDACNPLSIGRTVGMLREMGTAVT